MLTILIIIVIMIIRVIHLILIMKRASEQRDSSANATAAARNHCRVRTTLRSRSATIVLVDQQGLRGGLSLIKKATVVGRQTTVLQQ